MQNLHEESSYPLTFRQDDAKALGQTLAARHSISLIGMKRVGISNFLRFTIYRDEVVPTYVHPTDRHLFIPVDCNDLVEIGLLPFWSLTLKRIVDIVNRNDDLAPFREQINEDFVRSIQLRDTFYTVDTVRSALQQITAEGYLPTIFFLRFDRMQQAVTPEFLQNLKGLVDACGQALAYVFTTYRELDVLMPEVFMRNGTTEFAQTHYLKPADAEATQAIMATFLQRYTMKLSEEHQQAVLDAAAGHVQYLQLSLRILKELQDSGQALPDDIVAYLQQDERIQLQSDELFATLSPAEQSVVRLSQDRCADYSAGQRDQAAYLWNTGYINTDGCIFSPFLHHFLVHGGRVVAENGHTDDTDPTHGPSADHTGHQHELTKKEHLLYEVLTAHRGEVTEREQIIRAVWPECNEIGVSDWAVDRLVARLRAKLKQQAAPDTIKTVKTRGFLLQSPAP